ncbi:MAG: hypothetical protein K0V04_00190 [Deltaproteobacteria bacterium]|nr:hypothetical protein [Deltaproteobacteria bacterium]
MRTTKLGLGVGALAIALMSACGGPEPTEATGTGGIPIPPTTTDPDPAEADTGTILDVGNGSGGMADDGGNGDCTPLPTNATLTGTVHAPNLEIPISGALVYVTPEDPEPVPDGVYCAECVEIPCNSHFVLTEPDGTFELPAPAGAGQTLVVQKGQFMHRVDIDVVEGNNVIADADSNLPGEWNPDAGMWVPRIAVVESGNDSIFNVLAKIGMGSVDGNGGLVNGSENFDLLSQSDGGALLEDLDAMRQYHIIFIPCMSQVGMGSLGQTRLDNIRQWVEEGGKWYVTDWANEYLYQSFPNYQTLHGQSFDPDLGYYDTTGIVLDADLLAWLEALPAPLQDIGGGHPNLLSLPSVEIVDNWSGIDEIPSVIVQDQDGNDVDVGHHAWVEGVCPACTPSNELRPMTISAEYGCGRMMFSTYHTDEGEHPGLTPQELILLYIILEIGVCHDAPPPPPPPVG